MRKRMFKTGFVALLVAVISGVPAHLLAQTTNKPATVKKTSAATPAAVVRKPAPATQGSAIRKEAGVKPEPAAKPKASRPFHGKLAEVDETAKTIKCGKSIYYITSQTKITKDGKPATLQDGVVGEPVSGYVDPTEDGKMAARTVRFGPKPESGGSAKRKPKDETEQ